MRRAAARRVTGAAARRAAAAAVDRLNALHDRAHAAGWPPADAIDADLADGLHAALDDLRRGAIIVPARPKRTALDLYFRRAGVDGMTDPLFLETLVASDVLPFERPFVVAHEWSHLAGFADEGDANFVGFLACTRSSIGGGHEELCAGSAAGSRGALAVRRRSSAAGGNQELIRAACGSAGLQACDGAVRAALKGCATVICAFRRRLRE
ncbi:MAG: hypothetical protein DMF93_04575 [Acidobacteria bacterium]|nr:MAG: hypothetical protein DMF93_04575 [Acidobacteriota bacterium]